MQVFIIGNFLGKKGAPPERFMELAFVALIAKVDYLLWE